MPTEAIKKPPHQIRIEICAQAKADFKDWCQVKGFGTGGMTRAITSAIQHRDEVRIYAEFSFHRREATAIMGVNIAPELFKQFESWCSYHGPSMSSVIRGWIDHREQIAPYIQPRTDSLQGELAKAQQVIQEVEKIYNAPLT